MPKLAIARPPLREHIALSGRYHGAKVLVDHEDKQPFGTFKDRRCAALLEAHAGRPKLVFVQITRGNSGYSLGELARQWEKQTRSRVTGVNEIRIVVNIVPKGLAREIKRRLESCSVVVEVDTDKRKLTQDELFEIAKAELARRGVGKVDDGNFVGVESYHLDGGYGRMIGDIAEQMIPHGSKPGLIFCPVGEGELLVELADAAAARWGDQAPKIIGVTVKENILSAVPAEVASRKRGARSDLAEDATEDPETGAKSFMKTRIGSLADKLINPCSKFRDRIIDLVAEGKAEIVEASEREIAREYAHLKQAGEFDVEPSAAVAFVGARKYELTPQDVIVIVNTGKGIYDQNAADKMFRNRVKRFFKAAALVVTGAILSSSIYLGVQAWVNYQIRARTRENQVLRERNKTLRARDGELSEMVEFNRLDGLVQLAKARADYNKNSFTDAEELERVCNIIPDRDPNDCKRGPNQKVWDVWDLTERELQLYVDYTATVGMIGMIEADMRRIKVDGYVRETAEKGRETQSVIDRIVAILNRRTVKNAFGEEPTCVLYDFNPDRPFDPGVMPRCDQ